MRTFAIAVTLIIGLSTAVTAVRLRGSGPEPGGSPQVARIGEMSVERAAHQATLLANGDVLITGGCAGRGCRPFHGSAEIYDPVSREFRAAAPMAVPRASHTATFLRDGRVLVAGGCSDRGATDAAEVYDPRTGGWTPVGHLTQPRCSHTAVPLADGRVFIMGGEDRVGYLASAEVFDPASASFAAVDGMREPRYLATRLADGRILLTGGQAASGEVLRTAEIFDPASGRFQATGAMATPRVKHAAALLEDGRVLIMGGSDQRGYDSRFPGTEVYDPRTGRFSPGPEMGAGRHKIRNAVAALASGAILVAGGASNPEIYDPAGGVFLPLRGELSGPQMFATATVLGNGEVLVLGGYDERIRSAASAWIIQLGG